MALKTDLIGVWCESSSPGDDQHTNTLTLTDHNTVGTTTGKVGTAGDFTAANSEYFSRADDGTLSAGNADWTEAVWVQIKSKPSGGNLYIIDKTNAANAVPERVLLYRNFVSEDRFRTYIGNFAVGVAANTFGSPALNTWYYLQAQHDAGNNLLRIRVNDGAWDEVGTGGTDPTGSADGYMYLGTFNDAGIPVLFFDGLLNQYAFWKTLKTDEELNELYNGGVGLAFSEWDGLTAVTQDSVSQWNVVAAVTQDSVSQWNVVSAVTQDSVSQWNVVASINKDEVVQWNIVAAVNQDSVSQWNVVSSIDKDLVTQWNIIAAITQDSVSQWNIVASIDKDGVVQWNIIVQVVHDCISQWNTIAAVQKDSVGQWNIIASLNKDAVIQWHIDLDNLVAVTCDKIFQWYVIQHATFTALPTARIYTVRDAVTRTVVTG